MRDFGRFVYRLECFIEAKHNNLTAVGGSDLTYTRNALDEYRRQLMKSLDELFNEDTIRSVPK